MDILGMITKNLPEGALSRIADSAGVDGDTVGKILEKGAPAVAGPLAEKISEDGFVDKALSMVNGGEGGIMGMILGSQTDSLTKSIAEKIGVSDGIVKTVLEKIMPYILDAVKSGKINAGMLTALAGLSDGFDMSDVANIAGAALGGDGEKKSGGILGMLSGLFGK